MQPITIKRGRTLHCRKMRLCIEPSSDLEPLSASRYWPDYIINTFGYDFRKGQPPTWSGSMADDNRDYLRLLRNKVQHILSNSPRMESMPGLESVTPPGTIDPAAPPLGTQE